MLGFLGLILAGTGLLMLSAASREAIPFIDALFTATSAVCVTGLTVVDTGTGFTLLGQWVIVGLIQLGGLGIMTVSTFFIMVAGKRITFSGHNIIRESYSFSSDASLVTILRDIIFFTVIIEGLGMLIMFFVFFSGTNGAGALYLACFHSVSAFCNAGFGLFPDSFSGYVASPVVNLTIGGLVILGGLGFPVLSEVKQKIRVKGRLWRHLSLHSKLVFSVTGILILLSSMGFAAMEWDNTLKPLSLSGKCLAAFFQAVNTRTSGFNSLPLHTMANETLFMMALFMFIGASPGSCGGGVKTTTFAILVWQGVSRFKGDRHPQLFGRSISEKSLGKAVSIVLMSAFIISLGLMALLMTELGSVSHPQSRGKFLELLFEVVSAFGTVGLSTGVTGTLSPGGKIIIIFLMFLGRLGPMAVAVALTRPVRSRYYYVSEDIMIG